jgi:hypothetical protein
MPASDFAATIALVVMAVLFALIGVVMFYLFLCGEEIPTSNDDDDTDIVLLSGIASFGAGALCFVGFLIATICEVSLFHAKK